VSNTINSRDFSALLGRFTAPVDQRPNVLDIAWVSFCVFEKLKLNNKATRIKRNTLKLIAGASQVRQKPRLLLSHFFLVLAAVLNYSTMYTSSRWCLSFLGISRECKVGRSLRPAVSCLVHLLFRRRWVRVDQQHRRSTCRSAHPHLQRASSLGCQ